MGKQPGLATASMTKAMTRSLSQNGSFFMAQRLPVQLAGFTAMLSCGSWWKLEGDVEFEDC